MIPLEIAEVLGLEPELSKERIEIITASGVERAPLITLKSIVVLGKRIERVEAVVHGLPPKSYVDGLLGVKSLVELKLKIDFDEGILEV